MKTGFSVLFPAQRPMQDLNDLYYYTQVVEHGGFAPAGRALGLSKSRLSRRVASLEERLGVLLIQRSTRSFMVTELGQVYYERCKAVIEAAQAAQAAIDFSRGRVCGSVRLSCPIGLLHEYVGKMVMEYMLRFPQVTVILMGMNRRVHVENEGLDLAVRMQTPPLEDSSLFMRVLGRAEHCLVASRELCERHAVPEIPADLSSWPSLGYGPPEEEHVWILRGQDGMLVRQPHEPRLVTTDLNSLRRAALAGIGVVCLPQMIVDEDLEAGRLERLLPDWQFEPKLIHAVFAPRRELIPAVRHLIDHLAEGFSRLGMA